MKNVDCHEKVKLEQTYKFMQYIMQPLGGWGAGQTPGGLARLLEKAAGWSLKAGWSLEGWLGWAASWSLKSRLAGLLGRAACWSLKGWLDCWVVLLAGP